MRKAGWVATLGITTAVLVADRRRRASMARRSERLGTRAGTVEVEITGAGPDLQNVLALHSLLVAPYL